MTQANFTPYRLNPGRPTLRVGPQNVIPIRTGQTPPVTFGGERKSLLTKLLLLATAILPLGIGLKPAVAQQPAPVSGPVAVATVTREADIDEVAHPFVNRAADVPQINHDMKQAVVDLARSPLLTPQTRQELETLLQNFNSGEAGQMAVVIIPDTHQSEINTLATNLFNEIGIGHGGKNDGAILLVNKAAVQEGRSSGRMQIVSGKGIQNHLNSEKAVSLLRQHAVPHLKKGDYDGAVKATVQGVTEYLNDIHAKASHASVAGQAEGAWTEEQVAGAVAIGVIALIVLAGVIGLSVANSDPYGSYRSSYDSGLKPYLPPSSTPPKSTDTSTSSSSGGGYSPSYSAPYSSSSSSSGSGSSSSSTRRTSSSSSSSSSSRKKKRSSSSSSSSSSYGSSSSSWDSGGSSWGGGGSWGGGSSGGVGGGI